jgi:hypothetical protein
MTMFLKRLRREVGPSAEGSASIEMEKALQGKWALLTNS